MPVSIKTVRQKSHILCGPEHIGYFGQVFRRICFDDHGHAAPKVPWGVIAWFIGMGAMAVASLGHRGTVYDRSAVKDPAARDVANLVDRVVQDRFRRPLDRTFGISRIARPEDARMIHSRSTVDADRPLLAKAEASERAWRVLYYPTRSLKEDSLKVRDFPHGPGLTPVASSKRPAKGVVSAAFLAGAAAILKEHEPFLNDGRSLEASVEDWRLYARPVLADKSCIDCHTGSREGQPLGVVAYVVEGPAAEGN